jgi:lipopolysaccharide transport system permease protein
MATQERSRETRLREEGTAASTKHVLEIVGGPGGVSRDAFRELWLFRDVLWAFARRQIKVRYKQAVVGLGWVVLQPIVAAAIFAVFLGRYTGLTSEGVPYLLFALGGMVVWTYFSGAATNGASALVNNQSMLRKLYFPREILPFSSVISSLADFVPGLAVLGVVAGLYGYLPGLTWFALPLLVLVILIFAAAFSLALSAVNVYYRDVNYALPFILQIGLFASPVIYSLTTVPAAWRTLYECLNPVAAVIDALRRTMIHGEWPQWTPTLGALVWSLFLLAVSYVFFKRLERGFSDRI